MQTFSVHVFVDLFDDCSTNLLFLLRLIHSRQALQIFSFTSVSVCVVILVSISATFSFESLLQAAVMCPVYTKIFMKLTWWLWFLWLSGIEDKRNRSRWPLIKIYRHQSNLESLFSRLATRKAPNMASKLYFPRIYLHYLPWLLRYKQLELRAGAIIALRSDLRL